MKDPATCHAMVSWLKANFGRGCTGGLTGCDWRALRAFVHLVELLAVCDGRHLPHVYSAINNVVMTMQEKERWLAFHVTAMVMDWDDRKRVWELAGLPLLDSAGLSLRAANEPRTT